MTDVAPPHALAAIASFHAHVYYDPRTTRAEAEWLRERIAERFAVRLGRWHDVPVGPHAQAMYQVAFETARFADLVPWLMVNRRGLTVLVHPNTGAPRADHLDHALWLGPPLALNGDVLPPSETPGAEVPNTAPSITP